MIVIANKTEPRLFKDLQRCVRENPAQKCFFIELSKSDIPRKKLFEAFLRALEELPNSYMAQVYLCQNKDVFILMQGFMQRHFVEFVEKLSIVVDMDNLADMSKIFEVGIHWEQLEVICKERIEEISRQAAEEEKEKIKASEEMATVEAFNKLDPEKIHSMSQRRSLREDALILVVDDDQLARTLVGNVLNQDYTVCFAHTGAEAIEKNVEYAPDVVFLDIGLPDVNGYNILEYLFLFDPDAYVIMFSGRKNKENIVRALEAGALGFIGKPFTRDKLFEYIKKSPFVIEKQQFHGQLKKSS